MVRFRAILGVVGVALCLARPAWAVGYGDVAVTIEPVPTGNSSHGYTAYGVWVTNSSTATTHQVTFTLPKTDYQYYGNRLRAIIGNVEVGPGKRVRAWLFQPSEPPLNGMDLGVTIDGREQQDPVPINLNQGRSPVSYGYSTRYPVTVPAPRGMVSVGYGGQLVLLSRSTAFVEKMMRRGGGINPSQFPYSDVPITEWSDRWLAYSRYDGVMVTADDLRKMPSGAQTALMQYVECGGSLIVLGTWSVPESWKGRKLAPRQSYTIYQGGFGQCLVTDNAAAESIPADLLTDAANSWIQTSERWNSSRSSPSRLNSAFPVVESVGIPVRGLFILMVVFALAIGPLSLYVLARKNRRIWMLWTVPAISLVTCLAVFGYMLLLEGWEGHLRTEGLTILDQTTHRATTIGLTAFYSPVTPSDGLHFGPDTELSPQLADDAYPYRRGGGAARTIDWGHGEDQHLSKGWVTARTPAYFMVRKSEVRRERVSVSRGPDGTLTMVNGLGAEIQDFWYADENNWLYSAGPVASGSRVVLTATGKQLTGRPVEALRQVYQRDSLTNINNLSKSPQTWLLPREYLATLEASLFIEDGLAKAKTRKTRAVVLGILKESGDES
jgi:hypothetical protein